jgi:hypothetical protein
MLRTAGLKTFFEVVVLPVGQVPTMVNLATLTDDSLTFC